MLEFFGSTTSFAKTLMLTIKSLALGVLSRSQEVSSQGMMSSRLVELSHQLLLYRE
jgi:hypothetical protein